MKQKSAANGRQGKVCLSRRQVIQLLSALTFPFLWGCKRQDSIWALTPEETEGPYYLDLNLVRQDIREGKMGVPLKLKLKVRDAMKRAALAGAAVDIWHCDALGFYSGYTAHNPDGNFAAPKPDQGPKPDTALYRYPKLPPPDGSTFLRGVQLTNADGEVEFLTIYPGWYRGRDIHIHVRVHTGKMGPSNSLEGTHICHTGQFFFPDATNDLVSTREPYAQHKTLRTPKLHDNVYQTQNGDQSVLNLLLSSANADSGFTAEFTLNVDGDATPASRPSIRPPAPSHRGFLHKVLRAIGL